MKKLKGKEISKCRTPDSNPESLTELYSPDYKKYLSLIVNECYICD